MRIGIIGTGVAGSLLADLLRDAPGIAVEAFERVAPGDHAEAGTGLNIGPNALKALRLHHPARHAAGGRAVFLGDAAQAMVPTLGQGATQAVECGVVAGRVLREGGGAAEIATARDARVTFARDFSWMASDTLLPGVEVAAATRAKASPDFVAKLRRLYTEVS